MDLLFSRVVRLAIRSRMQRQEQAVMSAALDDEDVYLRAEEEALVEKLARDGVGRELRDYGGLAASYTQFPRCLQCRRYLRIGASRFVCTLSLSSRFPFILPDYTACLTSALMVEETRASNASRRWAIPTQLSARRVRTAFHLS